MILKTDYSAYPFLIFGCLSLLLPVALFLFGVILIGEDKSMFESSKDFMYELDSIANR